MSTRFGVITAKKREDEMYFRIDITRGFSTREEAVKHIREHSESKQVYMRVFDESQNLNEYMADISEMISMAAACNMSSCLNSLN